MATSAVFPESDLEGIPGTILSSENEDTSDQETVCSNGGDKSKKPLLKFPGTNKRDKKGGPTPHRYTDAEDILILKEVLMEKAPRKGAADKWRSIFERVNISVKDYKAIRTRFDVLLSAFTKDEATAFRGSGLEEDYDEKKRLMTDIVSQKDEWVSEVTAVKEKQKKDDSHQKAQVIRQASLKTLADPDEDSERIQHTPKRRRVAQTSSDLFELIKNSEEAERESKNATMQLESKRLEIMERDSKRQEENDIHRREMEKRQMDIEERRLDMELRRIELENQRAVKEQQERAVVLQLLGNQNKK